VEIRSLVGGRWCPGEDPNAEALWFNIEEPDAAALETLRGRFGLHPLAVEDCLSPNPHAPKIDEFRDHIFLVFVAPATEGTGATEEFDAFLGDRFVVTYADRPIVQVAATAAVADGETGRHLRPGADGLLYEIVDRMVDDFLPATHEMAEALDEIEDRVLAQTEDAPAPAILGLRTRAGKLRRLLSAQQIVFQRLSRGEFSYVTEPNRIYYRDIFDHLVRIDLALEGVREDAEMALSSHLSALNNRMNEVMKVLSLVAALALPATVIAGIFGTNFDNVPGLHSNWGFALMLGAMAMLASSMAVYFKRRGWW
jgi:magnesium transporter